MVRSQAGAPNFAANLYIHIMIKGKERPDQNLIRILSEENPDGWHPFLEEDLDFTPKPTGRHTNPITPTSLGTGLLTQQKKPRDLRNHE